MWSNASALRYWFFCLFYNSMVVFKPVHFDRMNWNFDWSKVTATYEPIYMKLGNFILTEVAEYDNFEMAYRVVDDYYYFQINSEMFF